MEEEEEKEEKKHDNRQMKLILSQSNKISFCSSNQFYRLESL